MNKPQATHITVSSTDSMLMGRLFNWLEKQEVPEGSTVLRIHEHDPSEILELTQAQLEGVVIRMQDAERRVMELEAKATDLRGEF